MNTAELENDLARRKADSLYRSRLTVDSAPGTLLEVNGKRLLSFCSNDYLGLANHQQLKKAFVDAAQTWGVGSGSAHLVTGHSRIHHELEERLAEFTGRQRALLFSSGYMANLALINAFLDKNDQLYQDRLNHASLIDAGNLSPAKLRRYQHADISSLERMLDDPVEGKKMIVTDGVFSMDGDIAPLDQLARLSSTNDALLAVDDAHGFGVLGKHGAGSLEYFHLNTKQVPLLMCTLGKAMGAAGAFIAGDEVYIETLIQKARSYIYTTAQPAAVAAAALAAIELQATESWRRDKVLELVAYFKKGAGQLGLALPESNTPIQPLITGNAATAGAWAKALRDRGILVTAIRPPTVPQNTARLRITFSADHTEQQVDQLLDALEVIANRENA